MCVMKRQEKRKQPSESLYWLVVYLDPWFTVLESQALEEDKHSWRTIKPKML
jgi:hypothetical protein